MFHAFPWKTDTENDKEHVQMKLTNLQRDTNVTFSRTKLQNFYSFLPKDTYPQPRSQIANDRNVQQKYVSEQCRPLVDDIFFSFGAPAPQWARAASFTRFLDHTQRRTTVGRTPLDE